MQIEKLKLVKKLEHITRSHNVQAKVVREKYILKMSEPASNAVNSDELEAPDWLNKDFFTKVLQHCEKVQDIKIQNLELKAATAKNDHYASVMFRAVMDYNLKGQLKNKSMVLKILPEIAGHKKDMLEQSHIFETEIGIYSEIIPKFEAILKDAGDKTKLGPTCIYHSLSPKKIIIYEDLALLGYTAMRGRQAYLEEVKAAYTKLAKWHAVGFKLLLEQPHIFDAYRHGIMNTKSFQESDTTKNGILYFIEMLDAHKDLVQYKPYFEAIKQDNLLQRAVATFEEFRKAPEAEAYYVLCHGDFHDKNFMLKLNEKTVQLDDLMLLDYQLSYVGPIVNDIIYSIYMMLDTEQRLKHLDELLYFYFTNFQETLQRIGYDGPMPKMLEFLKQIMRQKSFGIFLLTSFLPIWYGFKEVDFDPENMATSADYHRKVYTNPKYLEDVRKLLPRLLHQGYLEVS